MIWRAKKKQKIRLLQIDSYHALVPKE